MKSLPKSARKASEWFVPRRCKCGSLASLLFQAVLPNLPAGKVRVEGGVTLDGSKPAISTDVAVEGQSWSRRSKRRSKSRYAKPKYYD